MAFRFAMTIESRNNFEDIDVRAALSATARITPELIRHTIAVWQTYYPEPLTEADAIAIIENVARLITVLAEEDRHETVRRTGPRQQS